MLRGLIKKTRLALFAFFLLYTLIILIGLFPLNNSATKSSNEITIYLISNNIHTDIAVPRITETVNWDHVLSEAKFSGDVSLQTHLAFGWGDRGFYLEAENISDLTLSAAFRALFMPSKTAMHVTYLEPNAYADVIEIAISNEQYKLLTQFILDSFRKDSSDNFVQINGMSYTTTDAFFEAHGSYHLFNTCNSWTGRALEVTGVTVPLFTPLPKTPLLYIQN